MQVYHLNGPAPLYTNSYLVISAGGHAAVIDPVAPAEEYGRLLGQAGAELAAIFCTHGHFDHVGTAEALKRRWPGAVLYCEAADVQGNEMYPLRQADSGYTEGGAIPLDELEFVAWHTPGHTEGSVCLLCGELFFTGDTLFAGDTGRTDLPGGSLRKMVASCKKLMTLPVPPQAQVLPGHEESSTYAHEMAHNYFIQTMCR